MRTHVPWLPSQGRPAGPQLQRLAIPAYFPPGPQWAQLHRAAPIIGLAVLNPSNGPGTARDGGYAQMVRVSQAAGTVVLGYVHTQHGARDPEEVSRDVANHFAWYGVGGIFVDETSVNLANLPYYVALANCIKARHGRALIVLNPGMQTNEEYMEVADIIVTFEGDYATYARRYASPSWVRRHPPERFWHLIYAASTPGHPRRAILLSRRRGAGWVYVTAETLPNPWGRLPRASYWSDELVAAAQPAEMQRRPPPPARDRDGGVRLD